MPALQELWVHELYESKHGSVGRTWVASGIAIIVHYKKITPILQNIKSYTVNK